jgi:hypothetical protein
MMANAVTPTLVTQGWNRIVNRVTSLEKVPDRSKLVQPEVRRSWLMSEKSNGVSGRRFLARDWDSSLPPTEVVKKAGTPAGWEVNNPFRQRGTPATSSAS